MDDRQGGAASGAGASMARRRLWTVALACVIAACGRGDDDGDGAIDTVTGLPRSATVLVATDNGRALYVAAPGVGEFEVRLDKPSGPLLARIGAERGHLVTGDWIRDGMRFHLQDVTGGRPLAPRHTLATAVATVAHDTPGRAGVVFGATPGVAPDPEDTGTGATTLFWSAPGTAVVELRVDAPDGPLFARAGPVGSRATGRWIRDGMRFYLQDGTSATPTSPAGTLAVATVDLQPARQRFVAFYRPDAGVVTYSRDAMHRLGAIPPDALPPGVTALDMRPSPDGTRLYLLGSDARYHVLDPATDAVTDGFPAGSQATAFGFMKGPKQRDLLIAAPDALGRVAIVDPALRAPVAVLACGCTGSVSGILVDPATGTAYFVSDTPPAPPATPAVPPPVPGPGNLVLHSIGPDLALAEPFRLPLPATWGPAGASEQAGADVLLVNDAGRTVLLAAWRRFQSGSRPPPRPADVVAYDLRTRGATLLTGAFTSEAVPGLPELDIPLLAAPDGASLYAQPLRILGVRPYQSRALMPGALSRYDATPGSAWPYAPAAALAAGSPTVLVTPPLALDDRQVFFGQVGVVGPDGPTYADEPTGPFLLRRADRSSLVPAARPRIVVDDAPVAAARAPLVGLSLGAYAWPGPADGGAPAGGAAAQAR